MPYCFVQADTESEYVYDELSSIKIYSTNDLASKDGHFLYGGLLDRCRMKTESWETVYSTFIDNHVIRVNSQIIINKGREITSEPYDLCVCNSNQSSTYRFCVKTHSVQVYRGQQFLVPLHAIAQVGTTSTTVTAITSAKAKLEIHQTSQQLPDHCFMLPYTVYSIGSHEQVVLYSDGPCRDTGDAGVIINVTLLPCPNGFTQFEEVCICEGRLQQYHVNCTIAEDPYMTKESNSQFWMGVLYVNMTYQGLILGKSCPVEYCEKNAVQMTLTDPDVQCDLNRTGLLCGACATNYSLMLGSSKCQICSNSHLVLLLPFAAAGMALVVFLTFLRLTIATGTLNSVILYAKIVQVNRKIFFSGMSKYTHSIYSLDEP